MDIHQEICDECGKSFKSKGKNDLTDWQFHFCSKKCRDKYLTEVTDRMVKEIWQFLPEHTAAALVDFLRDEPLYRIEFLAKKIREKIYGMV